MLTEGWAVIRIRRIGQSNFKTRLCGLNGGRLKILDETPVSLMSGFQTAFYMDWDGKYPKSPSFPHGRETERPFFRAVSKAGERFI